MSSQSYELLLKGGRVVDAGQGLDGQRDIAISSGRVAALEADIPESHAAEVIDVEGKVVTPGLVDLHAHVYWGTNELGVDVDTWCLSRGVTTTVDAGSAGALSFPGFRRYVVEASQSRVLAFLNINPKGMSEFYPRRPVYDDLGFVDVDRPIRVINENKDVILGTKVTMSQHYTGDSGMQPLWLARFVADKVRGRVMVHIGNSDIAVSDILAVMRGGDILTHCFNGYVNGILGWDGRVLGAVSEAVARGVVLDVAHGSGSLSFEVAEMGLAQGLRPTISTDLHSMCIHGPVYDLPTTMSKFLALGLSLEDVVRATTIDAAKAIGRDEELGTLRVGMSADVAVFDIRTGRFEFHDSHGRELKGSQMISPVLVVRAGEVVCRAEEAEV